MYAITYQALTMTVSKAVFQHEIGVATMIAMMCAPHREVKAGRERSRSLQCLSMPDSRPMPRRLFKASTHVQ